MNYKISDLKIINNDKGDIYHGFRAEKDKRCNFKEIYFSRIKKNITKGWKRHNIMTCNLLVIKGEVIFYISERSPKKLDNGQWDFESIIEVKLSENNPNYKRLTIYPKTWLAFKSINEESIICNLSDLIHDDNEVDLIPFN